MIGIFDYGVGNLLNLKNAIDHLGLENCIVQNSDQLESCSRMLLPGVGAFAPAMEHLRGSGMFKRLQEKVENGNWERKGVVEFHANLFRRNVK